MNIRFSLWPLVRHAPESRWSMRKPDPKLQADRRDEILNAASRCFARAGFHGTSMQDLCAEAGMSPGGLYRYFPSKEAIIAGISERDRNQLREALRQLDAAPDFMSAFEELGRQQLIERSLDSIGVWAEIISESRRNPGIASLYAEADRELRGLIAEAMRKAAARGELDAGHDFDEIVHLLFSLGDGLCWRRIIDPTYDPARVLAMACQMLRVMLTQPPAAPTLSPEPSDLMA
jgi:AcrR family transcriptional regulator